MRMNIREELLKDNSKEVAEQIAAWVVTTPKRMQEFLHIFLTDEYRVVQMAAHALGKIADDHPQALQPYLDQLVKRMQDPDVHIAVKRNVVRVLQYVDIPEHLHGEVMNTCFDMLADPNEAIAVRVFSMTVLDHLSKSYPEIKQELKAIIEDQLEQGCTAAFRARAKTILKGK
ncbi:MAG: hypothetical protein H6550_03100 [Chitinophagales bacterium]|nr:hypothetical protein [Chitinophagales bacterium]